MKTHKIKKRYDFDFLGKRNAAFICSGFLLIVSIFSLGYQGLNFGLDFTGGLLVEIRYKQAVELPSIRSELEKGGFENAVIQYFGSTQDVLFRWAPKAGLSNAALSEKMIKLLRVPFNEVLVESALNGLQQCSTDINREPGDCNVQVKRVEYVGPQVGDELAEDGGLAMLYAMIAILIYVSMRFEYRLAIGAVLALFHDVTLTLGFFSVARLEVDLTVLAAILAVIGYSINDTLVVFDRIRDNFRKIRIGSVIDIVNLSLNQTLSRTLLTSFTTLIVLISLFIFGGELIQNFSIALIIGIAVGTYSSIFVAAAAAVVLGISKENLIAVKKESADMDGMP